MQIDPCKWVRHPYLMMHWQYRRRSTSPSFNRLANAFGALVWQEESCEIYDTSILSVWCGACSMNEWMPKLIEVQGIVYFWQDAMLRIVRLNGWTEYFVIFADNLTHCSRLRITFGAWIWPHGSCLVLRFMNQNCVFIGLMRCLHQWIPNSI